MNAIRKTTLTYSSVNGLDVRLDAYVPSRIGQVPVLLWFHPGGLFAGGRDDFTLPVQLRGQLRSRSSTAPTMEI
jgi:acetyl esterase/lipase